MRARRLAAFSCALAALCGVSACGDSASDSDGVSKGSKNLTIYSSLPLQGPSRAQSVSVSNGETLALEEAGGKVGNFNVTYKSLDDADATSGEWDPSRTAGNARKAAQDRSAIAYLGDLDSGASAIAIPVLNQVGILQVSPSSTAVGLTRSEGAEKGEPDKYYPSGKRTFGRVVPADQIQAVAQVEYQKEAGCTRTFVLNDSGFYGQGLANQFVRSAKTRGLVTAGEEAIDPKAADYRSLANKVRISGADCVFFAGVAQNNGVQLFKDLHTVNPTAKLFGPDGVAVPAFSGNVGRSVAKVTYVTSPTLDPKLYPASGQKFFKDYAAKFGARPEQYAIFGYEAMSVVLQAIKNAGEKGNDREAVIEAFFNIRDRKSVLGTYSIDENGDTTLSSYGGNRIEDGKLVFDKLIDVKR